MPSHFVFFFSSTGRCAHCTPPCFHSFFPPGGGPPPRRSMGQHASHTLPRLVRFSPPQKTLYMTRWHGSHMPPRLGLFFPPSKVRDGMHPTRHLNLFFPLRGSPPAATAMTATTRWRESYMPPRFPFLFQHRGGVDPTHRLVLLHSFINEAVCTLHTATFCFLIIFVVTCNFF